MVRIGLLSAMAYVLYYFEIVIPPFPGFLKMDGSDLPAIVGAYLLGPLPALAIELIKNLLHMFLNGKTGGIGELANFIVGTLFVVPIGICVSTKKTLKNSVVGCVLGCVCMVIGAAVFNYFIMIPLFLNTTPAETLGVIIASIVPFNIIKSVILAVTGSLLVYALRPVLKGLLVS